MKITNNRIKASDVNGYMRIDSYDDEKQIVYVHDCSLAACSRYHMLSSRAPLM
jgi:hypothetical protein